MMTSAFDRLLDFERDIEDILESTQFPVRVVATRRTPAMTVADDKEAIVATFDLPGVLKEDLTIEKNGNTLIISGERKRASLPDKGSWLRSESWSGSFSRTIELPDGTNDNAISAELTNGVLRIVLPKAEAAKPRQIAIR